MLQEIVIEQNSDNPINTTHASFLVPFFTGMNEQFAGKWCVLHSYETLPYYSESDVDMAFAGFSHQDLEVLITEVASQNGWQLYQKLWYDVQLCCYYVLREKKSGTLLAIDFLTDNQGIGRYGFKTTLLTRNCTLINNLIPILNHETALSYKLVKRIEKERSLDEDDRYIKEHFEKSNGQKIASFLEGQYGMEGKLLLLSYLEENRGPLTNSELIYLKRKRQKRISTLETRTKFIYWETYRMLYRILHPSGMLVNIPKLEENTMKAFTEILKQKVDILFRFVKLGENISMLERFKGVAGSTLIVYPQENFIREKAVQYNVFYPKYLALNTEVTLTFDDLDRVTDEYLAIILKALSIRISSKHRSNG